MYDGAMDKTDKATLYRDSLRPAVREYVEKNEASPLYTIDLVDTVSIAEMAETVEKVESLISRFDFQATIDGGALYGSTTKKMLARWFAAGATAEARDMLAIRTVRDRPNLVVWKFVEAGVQPTYLKECLAAGITDSELISEGARMGLSIEYLSNIK